MHKPQRPTAAKHHGGAKGAVTKRGARPPDGAKKKKLRSIKNQIRGLERLLRKEGLDPRVQAQKQRELQQLHEVQAARVRSDRERKYAVRYHKVRFFERIKVERAMQKLHAQQKGGTPIDPTVQRQLEKLRDDLMYIKHFPKGEKYVSLLRNSDDPDTQAKLEAERAQLWQLVKQQMQEAAAIAEADEGRSLAAMAADTPAVDAADGSDHDAFELGTDSSDDEEPAGAEQGDSDDEAATAALAAARSQKQQQRQQQQGRPAQQQAGNKRAALPSTSDVPAKRMRPQPHTPKTPAPSAPAFAADDDFFLFEGESEEGADAGDGNGRAKRGPDAEQHANCTKATPAAAPASTGAGNGKPDKDKGHAGAAGKQQGWGQDRQRQQQKQWTGGPSPGARAAKPQGNQKFRAEFKPQQVHGGAAQRSTAADKQPGTQAAVMKSDRASAAVPQQAKQHPAGPAAKHTPHKAGAQRGPKPDSKGTAPKLPLRTRAEGGRKRRSKKG